MHHDCHNLHRLSQVLHCTCILRDIMNIYLHNFCCDIIASFSRQWQQFVLTITMYTFETTFPVHVAVEGKNVFQ